MSNTVKDVDDVKSNIAFIVDFLGERLLVCNVWQQISDMSGSMEAILVVPEERTLI